MGRVLTDVRFAIRRLAKSPGFTVAAILTLALGIGPTTVLFSAMGGVLLRPLPFHQPQELVWIWEVTPQGRRSTTSAAAFQDWRRQSQSFSQMAAYDFVGFNLGGLERPGTVVGASVSANLFDVLGVRPEIGRSFQPEEEQQGGSGVVVLSHRIWEQRFGGSREALGSRLILNDQPYTVIGVLPKDFWFFLDSLDVFVPLSGNPAMLADRSSRGYDVIARPRSGIGLSQAQAEMDTIAQQLAAAYPAASEGWTVRLQPVQAHYLEYFRPAMRILFLAVAVVLLITCANVANLLLAQGLGRQREFAIRMAVGASRAALVRLAVVESLLLAFAGMLLSVWLAVWTRGALVAILPAELQLRLPGGVAGVGVDTTLLVVMSGLAAATGLLMALLPAWQVAGRLDPVEAVKQGGGAIGGRRSGMRNTLVAFQVGFAAVALVVGAFLVKSYGQASQADTGLRTERVLRVGVSLSAVRYPTEAHRVAIYDQVLVQGGAVPGVESVSLVNSLLPHPNALAGPFMIEGRAPTAPSDSATANVRLISPSYFQQMGIRLVEGRSFTAADGHGAPGVVILSRAVAQEYWPAGDAVGRRIRIGTSASAGEWLVVAGVVEDVRHPLATAGAKILYRPIAQAPTPYALLLVRAAGDPVVLQGQVEKALWALDRELALWGTGPLAPSIAEELAHVRFTTVLVTLIAMLAVGLAVLGVFSSNAYAVRKQSREIGVRVALGAHSADVWRLIIRQGMTPVLWGGAVGLGAAAALVRVPLLSAQLHGASGSDPAVYAISGVLLVLSALAGCLWPARRATRIDPMAALRHE